MSKRKFWSHLLEEIDYVGKTIDNVKRWVKGGEWGQLNKFLLSPRGMTFSRVCVTGSVLAVVLGNLARQTLLAVPFSQLHADWSFPNDAALIPRPTPIPEHLRKIIDEACLEASLMYDMEPDIGALRSVSKRKQRYLPRYGHRINFYLSRGLEPRINGVAANRGFGCRIGIPSYLAQSQSGGDAVHGQDVSSSPYYLSDEAKRWLVGRELRRATDSLYSPYLRTLEILFTTYLLIVVVPFVAKRFGLRRADRTRQRYGVYAVMFLFFGLAWKKYAQNIDEALLLKAHNQSTEADLTSAVEYYYHRLRLGRHLRRGADGGIFRRLWAHICYTEIGVFTAAVKMEGLLTGLLACLVSSVLFGSFFVPLKHFQTTDGVFVQWVMGNAIFCVGLVVNLIEGCPPFYPLAMVGGALWSIGNITAVPIVNLIGMALGMLIWGFTNCLFGWASGRFGWFGLKEQKPESDLLNYLGLSLSLVGALMFALVKSEQPSEPNSVDDADPLLESDDVVESTVEVRSRTPPPLLSSSPPLPVPRFLRQHRHTIGVVTSLVAGVFYGLCFTPVIYIQDNYHNASKQGLPYVFAHFCGSHLMCTFFFLTYTVYMGNRPVINFKVALPSFVAGLMWAIAQASWFVANEHLSQAVSFPIITRFPGVIASLWGVIYFKEIKGGRNLQILFWAIIITVIGGILCGLSKASF